MPFTRVRASTVPVLLLLVLSGTGSSLIAQQTDSLPQVAILEAPVLLPDAPVPQAHASISGNVSGVNGTFMAEAQVVLTGPDGQGEHTMLTGRDGAFSFTNLPAGTYELVITSPDLVPFHSEITLAADENQHVPQIVLSLAGTTTEVHVTMTQVEIAQEQVKAAEKQRAFGVLPNFYSSYIWDAAPLNARQKFDLGFHSILDPFEFIGIGVISGAEQARNTFPGYEQGLEGYGKRYGAGYADTVASRMIGSALLPSILHQDPRYFYKGTGSTRSRIYYAVSRAVLTRGDNGHTQFNYSYVLGAYAAGGISNLYRPAGDRGAGLVFRNSSIDIAGHALSNLLREFVLRRVTPSVPQDENGQASTAATGH